MKDKPARALAVIALVFMGIFTVMLVMTIVDRTMLGGSVGFIALGCGVFALVIFGALKADGRGFSITKMNNEAEMKKIERELEKSEREESESVQAESNAPDATEENGEPKNFAEDTLDKEN